MADRRSSMSHVGKSPIFVYCHTTRKNLSGPLTRKRLWCGLAIQPRSKTMTEFVFLYRGGARDRSPEQMQQVMQKWMAWMKDLGEKGHLIDRGQPLERAGKVVQGKQKTVTDGPFAEAKDVVGGYTLIEAEDLDEAVELSKGCPIFEVEGAVEVRPVMKLNMGWSRATISSGVRRRAWPPHSRARSVFVTWPSRVTAAH